MLLFRIDHFDREKIQYFISKILNIYSFGLSSLAKQNYYQNLFIFLFKNYNLRLYLNEISLKINYLLMIDPHLSIFLKDII